MKVREGYYTQAVKLSFTARYSCNEGRFNNVETSRAPDRRTGVMLVYRMVRSVHCTLTVHSSAHCTVHIKICQ